MMMKRNLSKKQRGLVYFLLVFAFTWTLAFPSGVQAEKDPIKVGIVLPLSGGLELFGQQGIQGAKLAVAEINAAGGVLGGRKFELIIEDD